MSDPRELLWHLNLTKYPSVPAPMLLEAMGLIPYFLYASDPRPAIDQFDERYQSGWDDFGGFTMSAEGYTLKYPGDPEMHFLGMTTLHDDIVLIYPYGWVCVKSPDGTFEVARLD